MMSKLSLRPVTASDLPIFYLHQADKEAAKMAAFPSRDEENFYDHWHKIMADADNILLTVEVDGEVAGNVVSFKMDGVREVGYWIGRKFWGRGIATTAIAAFLEEMKIRPLYAHVAKTNPGSMRVLEKCGFILQSEDATEVIYQLD
jgi:RimJ/RimL family protein N-acetyltransferase